MIHDPTPMGGETLGRVMGIRCFYFLLSRSSDFMKPPFSSNTDKTVCLPPTGSPSLSTALLYS